MEAKPEKARSVGDDTGVVPGGDPTQAVETAATPSGNEIEHAHAWSLDHGEEPGVESKWRGRLLWAALVGLLCAMVAALVWFSTVFYFEGRPTTKTGTPGTSTPAAQVPITAPGPSTPTFSPKAIDRVLLTADELSKLLTANFSDNPSVGGPGGLGLNSSSYGTSDHSHEVTPPSCVGVVFTGEHDVYGSADPAAIKTQTFGTPYGLNAGTPHLLQQTAAVLHSVEAARQFLKSAEGKWKACGNLKVWATFGYESGAGYILGEVAGQDDMITLGMASTNNLGPTNGADACQQAMGVRQNVVVEVRTCEAPNVTSAPTSPDLVWVVPDAEKVARAMLDNVVP